MSFISLCRGRSRLPALAVRPSCTTRASVSTLRGGENQEGQEVPDLVVRE